MAGVVGDKRLVMLNKGNGVFASNSVLICEKEGQVVHNQAKRSIDINFQEFRYPPLP
jgi:hypothetical protein